MVHESCRECLLPEGKFGVVLDSNALCNYCAQWAEHRDKFNNYELLGKQFAARLDRFRSRRPFDALVGISGGKDSSYVLYSLVKKYNARVLAVSVDNGFLTAYARASIERIVENLGVQHFYFKLDWGLQQELYRAAFRAWGDPCIGCAIPLYFGMIKMAYERDIPFFVHGRSPFQMFRNFYPGTRDTFVKTTLLNALEYDPNALRELYVEMDEQARGWIQELFGSATLGESIYREFFLDPRACDKPLPEFLGYFVCHPYDEELMKTELESAVGYVRPPDDDLLSHADCALHDASSHLFRELHGAPPNMAEAAVMRRWGRIDREVAQVLGTKMPTMEAVERSIEIMAKNLEISPEEIRRTVAVLRKRDGSKFECH